MKKRLETDAAILLALLLLALVLHLAFRGGGGLTATVTWKGETVATVDLSSVTEETTMTVGEAVIAIAPGKIGFVSSVCHDRRCVRAGWLSKAGQTAACLPQQVVVTVSGSRGADGVTG